MAGPESSFYHFDQRGNTIALSDIDGTVTDKYAYDPFGTILNLEGTTPNEFLFLGEYGIIDDGNSLYYIRARYYSASIGRFITKDPLTGNDSDGQSLNRYIYALNNPIQMVDISGLSPASGASDETHDHILETIERWAKNIDDLGTATLASGISFDILNTPISPWPDTSILGGLAKGGTKIVSVTMRSVVGKKAITSVYVAYREGKIVYVGITDDLAARAATHLRQKGIIIKEIYGLTKELRSDARAVEQVLIEAIKLRKNGGSLLNQINSIGQNNPIYSEAKERGMELLRSVNFPGF